MMRRRIQEAHSSRFLFRVWWYVGNAVTLSSRLEHSCEPGTNLISQSNYDLLNNEDWKMFCRKRSVAGA
jgi:class 3 adenylate cyclase